MASQIRRKEGNGFCCMKHAALGGATLKAWREWTGRAFREVSCFSRHRAYYEEQDETGEVCMANCSTMKKGEVYVCANCGLELQVVRECDEDKCPSRKGEQAGGCTFTCCGEELVKK